MRTLSFMVLFIFAALFLFTSCPVEIDITPPADVISLEATPGDRSIQLQWYDPADDDLAYIYIRIMDPLVEESLIMVDSGRGMATLSGLVNNIAYQLMVYTVDTSYNQSAGMPAFATPVGLAPDSLPPGNVADLQIVPGNQTATLTWRDPGDLDLNRIQITRAGADAQEAYYVMENRETITIGGLENYLDYSFTVRSIDDSNNISSGVTRSVTPTDNPDIDPPGPVTNLAAVNGDGIVSLSWTDPPDADLTRIMIENDGNVSDPVYVDPGVEQVLAAGLNNQLYNFTLTALDSSGNTSTTTEITAFPAPVTDDTAPGQVADVGVTPGDGFVILSWTDPVDVDLARVSVQFDAEAPIYVNSGIQTVLIAGLTNFTSYTFILASFDYAGNNSLGLGVDGTPVVDIAGPAPVTGLSSTALDGRVFLTWTDPLDLDFEQIGISFTGPAASSWFVEKGVQEAFVAGLDRNFEYTFTLNAYDTRENASPAADILVLPNADSTPPGPMVGLTLTPGNRQLLLSWTNPVDADFAFVEVDYSGGTVMVNGTQTAVVIGNLENFMSYLFTLRAVDTGGNHSSAATISGTPVLSDDTAAPEDVTSATASVSLQGVNLTWTDPPGVNADTFSHILITHNRTGGTVPFVAHKGMGEALLTGLTYPGEYTFTVTASDRWNNLSAGVAVTATPDYLPPEEAPGAVISSYNENSVTLSWAADPGDADFDHISITHDGPDGNSPIIIGPGITSVTVTGLVANSAYNFVIRTVDTSGNTSAGANLSSPLLARETDPPAELGTVDGMPGEESVTITWSGLPTDPDFDHVMITRSGADPVIIPTGVTTATITGLTPGSTYTFYVRTVDDSGNFSTGTVLIRGPILPDTTPPSELSGLTSNYGNNFVKLIWSGDPPEVDFDHVEITHDQTGGGVPVVVAKGMTNVIIFGLINGTTYTFTVRTVDQRGNKSTGLIIVEAAAVRDIVPPANVTAESISVHDGSVTINWTDPGDGDLDHIEITHNLTGGDTPQLVPAGVGTLIWTGLNNNYQHTFTIRAADHDGNLSSGVNIEGMPNPETDISLHFTLNEPGDLGVLLGGARPEINKALSEVMYVTITAEGGSGYFWFVDSTQYVSYNYDPYCFVHASSLNPGPHTLTLVYTVAGVRYSEGYDFMVIN